MSINKPGTIGNLVIKNRTVRSATWTNFAESDGSVSPRLIEEYVKYVQGEVGLIICEHMHVSIDGQGTVNELQIHDKSNVESLYKLTDAIHKAGGLIFAQLEHAGVHSREYLTKRVPMGPSEMSGIAPNMGIEWSAKEMNEDDILEKIEDFAQAALTAKEVGFDGVQIHAAHGYLISQFLLKFYNKREDRWGGNIANRCRFLTEIYRRTRELVGNSYPVITKINAIAMSPDEVEYKDDYIQIIKQINNCMFDAIEISGGIIHTAAQNHPSKYQEKDALRDIYYESYCKLTRKYSGKTPLILVGGIRTLDDMNRIVNDNIADFVSLSRPLIRDPYLIKRILSGRGTSESDCISCNQCCNPKNQESGVTCSRRK